MTNDPRSTRSMLGVLSLDTGFPRVVGDVGNPQSYVCSASVVVVAGADAPLVVRDAPMSEPILIAFEAAARALEAKGVCALVSTCGFLVTAQARIAAAVRVPVMLSALSLVPQVRLVRPGRVGILTASRSALGKHALAAAGISPDDIAIAGLETEPAFAKTFLVPRDRQPETLNMTAIESAAVRAATDLCGANPDLGSIVLECGNLPPYADAIRAATGLPVFHLVDAAHALVAAGGQAA